ncbi:MAG: carbonic anhydrase [bacterium]
MNRNGLVQLLWMTALIVLLNAAGITWAKEHQSSINAEQALEQLQSGNQHFLDQQREYPHLSREHRELNAREGQHPFVTLITCSDSRVPEDHIFDAGVGDIFVIRVAGNVCDTDEIGSIEYGVDHLGTPLLVVLGHTRCGAVTAVAQNAELHGSIPALVDNIKPAVEQTRHDHPELEGDELVSAAIIANVWQAITDLLQNSTITRERIQSGKLKVVGAVYQIDSGNVEWLGEHPQQAQLLAARQNELEHNVIHADSADQKEKFIHSVYFWLKEGTTEEQKQQLIQDCKEYLGAVETVQKLHVGIPAGTPRDVVDNTWGVSLIIFFQNKEDHDFYQKAEKHLQFIERNQSIWQRVQVYDMIQN